MILALVILAATLYVCYYFCWEKSRWPPGPRGLPFLGNVHQLDKSGPHHTLKNWAKEYGGIYKIRLFNKDLIILSGAQEIRDAMVKYGEEFSGRPDYFRSRIAVGEETLVLNYGHRFKLQKKVVMGSLKMHGDGLKKLEGLVLDILDELTKTIASTNSQPFDPSEALIGATNDIISIMVFGQCMPLNMKKDFYKYEEDVHAAASPEGNAVELDFWPWLRFLPFYKKNMEILNSVRQTWDNTGRQMVDTRKDDASYMPENPICLLDELLSFQSSKMNKENDGAPLFTDSSIRDITLNVATAGTTTTYTTLYSFVAICANHLDIQKQIQAQIDEVIGSRRPALSDRSSLPLVEAAILETLRYITQTALLLPHMTTTDVDFHGYTIPKNTEVWLNAWSLHHDERYWDEPWSFKPDRFLDEHGQLLPPDHPNRKRLVSFGAGQRVCSGEVLAKIRLFLFYSTLLQKFTFVPAAGYNRPDCDPCHFKLSVAMRPENYKICAMPRVQQAES